MSPGEQFGQGDEIPEGFAHFLPPDRDHVVMDPVMDPLRAAGGLVLGDLAFVMREHQVHSAPMDIEFLAEVFLAHDRALEVPAGESFAPGGGPAHDVLRLGLFPDREIVRGLLVTLAVQGTRPFKGRFEGPSGEDAVMEVPVVFLHVEIDGSVADIGVAGLQDLLHDLDLLDDVAGSAGFDRRGSDVELPHRLVIPPGIGLYDLHRLQILKFGFLRDLVFAFIGIVLQVADIRDVPDVADLVAEVLQEAEQDVVRDAGTGVSEMGVAVDGRPADVHADMAGIDRNEEFFFPGQGIGKV